MGVHFTILDELAIKGSAAVLRIQPRDREFLRLLLWRAPDKVTKDELQYLSRDPDQCVLRVRQALNAALGIAKGDKSFLATVESPGGGAAYQLNLGPHDTVDWRQARELAGLADADLHSGRYENARQAADEVRRLLRNDPVNVFTKALAAGLIQDAELTLFDSLRFGAQFVQAVARVKAGEMTSLDLLADFEELLDANEKARNDLFWECYATVLLCREGSSAAQELLVQQRNALGHTTPALNELLDDYARDPAGWRSRRQQLSAEQTPPEHGPRFRQRAGGPVTAPATVHGERDARNPLDADQLALTAVALLCCHQYDDGGWGRNLWRTGGERFSEDVPTSTPTTRRAMTVTAWAAHALASRLNHGVVRAVAQRGYEYCLRFFDEAKPAFGSIHRPASAMPGVVNDLEIVPNPRHTGSGLRLLHTFDGNSRQVARCVLSLIEFQHDEGGWAESPMGQANTLATAYVLDALMKAREHIDDLANMLDAARAEYMRARLSPTITEGLNWLARRQAPDGTWGYRDRDSYPELRPTYTAQVVACVPQLFEHSAVALNRITNYCTKVIAGGGAARVAGAEPKLATTAMLLFGLDRVPSSPVIDECREVCTAALMSRYVAQSEAESDVMAALFGLLAFSGARSGTAWLREAAQVVEVLEEIRPYGDIPGEPTIARVQERLVAIGHERLAPGAAAVLRDHPPM